MNNLALQYVYVIVIAASPKSVGWEKNAKNKLTSRKVDLSSSMDPVRCVQCFVTKKTLCTTACVTRTHIQTNDYAHTHIHTHTNEQTIIHTQY